MQNPTPDAQIEGNRKQDALATALLVRASGAYYGSLEIDRQ
jgi:hypothetical protein